MDNELPNTTPDTTTEGKTGLMDTRRGIVDDATQDDSPIPAKQSMGWAVIVPLTLWIGLGALIVVVFLTGYS